MRTTVAAFCCGMLAAFFPVCASGQDALRGVALVVGQSDYADIADLPNAAPDADAMGTMLNELGFSSSEVADRDARRLRRDLDAFLDDAEGADVALLYYAGHAVEVDGENYLVPTDAPRSSSDGMAQSLIPLGEVLSKLQSKAGVTIVLLDACRNNPFPAGTTIVRPGDAAPVAVSSTGLQSRGVVARAHASAARAGGLGIVVGFAAEPGKAALDGEPGAHSPYAAALLRHIGAMAGEEFGTVMRMVAQEVYLKTGGKQRPWTNESLQRLLYFGKTAQEPQGDEGDILKERRALLLTIAALPDFERRQVESAATRAGVPMDALYGMLKLLGADTPKDPARLDAVLRVQTDRLKDIVAERQALTSADPEIVRLSALADKAEREGALSNAGTLRERAKTRFRELESTLVKQEEALHQRFLEGAAVFARSAQTRALTFDYLGAAEDYSEAFRRVDGRDTRAAVAYKWAEAIALFNQGESKIDKDALQRSIAAFRTALGLIDDASGTAGNRAGLTNDLGLTLLELGTQTSSPKLQEDALNTLRAALKEPSVQNRSPKWRSIMSNMGRALFELGKRQGDYARIEQAIAHLRAARDALSDDEEKHQSALLQSNMGTALSALAIRRGDASLLEMAVTEYREALAGWTPEREPTEWATTQGGLGLALLNLARLRGTFELLDEAESALRTSLDTVDRSRAPAVWAHAQNNLGNVLQVLGERKSDAALLRQSAVAYRAALEERTFDRNALLYADILSNLGGVLSSLGQLLGDRGILIEANDALEKAQFAKSRAADPLGWAGVQNNRATVLFVLGRSENDTTRLEQAVAAYRAALEERTRERVPWDWAATQYNLGMALFELGERTDRRETLVEALAAYGLAASVYGRELSPDIWLNLQNNIGYTHYSIARHENGTSELVKAIEVYRKELDFVNRERSPREWANMQHNLASAYLLLGERLDSRRRIEAWLAAIDSWRGEQLVYTKDTHQKEWAYFANLIGYRLVLVGEEEGGTKHFEEAELVLREVLTLPRELHLDGANHTADSLCRALFNMGRIKRDRAPLLEARELCQSAHDALAALGDSATGEVAANLDRVNAALATLE